MPCETCKEYDDWGQYASRLKTGLFVGISATWPLTEMGEIPTSA